MERAVDVVSTNHRNEIKRSLGRLNEALHEPQYRHVEDMVSRMPGDGHAALATVTYLHSVERNPRLANVGRPPAVLYDCRECTDLRGWVVHDGPGHTWVSPCKKCRPLLHELWSRDHLDCHKDLCKTCSEARAAAGIPLASVGSVRPPPSDDDERDFI